MSLAKLFESKFRGDIRFRGAAYVQAERVAVTRVLTDELYAIVRDGVEFHTQLSRQDGELRMFCSCVGDGNTRDPACKHLWATLLAVDHGHLLSSPARPGHVPPFVQEVVPSLLDTPFGEDDDMGGDVYIPSVTRTIAAPTQMAASPVLRTVALRDWEAKLRELKTRMVPAVPTSSESAESRERELFYEVDVEESLKSEMLVIQTSQRQIRASGQWGKLKPLKVRPGKLEEIEHQDDRQILAYLIGGTPDRSGWFAQQAEFQSALFRYRLPYELCTLLLPLMCKTERLRFIGDEGKSPALTWDDGPEWTLCMALREEGEQDKWKLNGELRRGEEVMPLTDVRVIVPGGLVIAGTTISRVDDFGAFDWVRLLRSEQSLAVPGGEQRELVDQLLDMPNLPKLDLPEELRLNEIRAVPRAYLTLKSPRTKGWRHERLTGVVEFEYEGAVVPGASSQWAIVQREQGRCILRDREAENGFWSQLKEGGFRRLLDHRQTLHDVEIPVIDLADAVRKLIPAGWQVRADGKQVRQGAALQFRIRTGIDWFELGGDADFDGIKASFPELLAALKRGDNTIRLDDGSLGILPEEWLQQYGMLAGLGSVEEDHLRFGATQVGLLDALLEDEASVDVDEKFLAIRDKLRNFGGVEAADEPQGFKGTLRPYQKEGLGWLQFLQDFHFGGCLADDMGLGKTVQLLALLLERSRKAAERRPSLIVVPKSLLFNWVQEIQRFTPELSCVEYTGLQRADLREHLAKTDIVLTTYGTLRRDILQLRDIAFDYAVLDEAQTIKNANSQVAKACRLLKAEHRLALSGTPIENHLGDLWSIFEFLNPGMLGRSAAFRVHALDGKDNQSRQMLAKGIRPFVLRRTKREVAADLPDKFEETIFCQMGKRQKALYSELREHYRDSLLGMVKQQGMNKSRMHVLEALLRLRQAACHPALLDRETREEAFAKLDILVPQIEELIEEGHKSLVFSQFTSMLSILKEHLDKKGVPYVYLDGKTRNRKQVVEQFQNDPDTKVFLISLKAGGLGLNLTAAEYVFLLDPWWNPAVEAQAIDRAHRVGQTRQVFAYRLICKDTVEEKILELQKQKRELADAILAAEEGSVLDSLTAEDLEHLLS
ncbi:MAG: helicase SNF2 [Planctomycetota bacterium]|nr:MAG: helicase SNF2 [Planctomycetota bacterium]